MPIWIPVLVVGGIFGTGWALKEGGDAVEASTEAFKAANTLTKTLIVGGGLYVSYQALKSTGVLK